MSRLKGWLFDLYAAPQGGATAWVIDEGGERRRYWQPFPLTFYAAGPSGRLRELWRFLEGQAIPVALSRVERRDLFRAAPEPVLGVTCERQDHLQQVFYGVHAAFSDLEYYDVDIALSLRHAARHGTYPLAYCAFELDGERIASITPLGTPWELDLSAPPLRVLRLAPDSDPSHSAPLKIEIEYGRISYALPLHFPRGLLTDLNAILKRYDPDLILTRWGDTWLLPRLLELSREWKIPLAFNRDAVQEIAFAKERSYFSYGKIVYRGQQVHLFGRWHIDGTNALLYDDFDLEGIYETARVTRLPVQTSARVSPGTGVSSMQIVKALEGGILVPWRKQQSESFKTALDLIRRDQGGLVYQPLIGVHPNVAEVDFVSMYPGLMVRFNISPETAGEGGGDPEGLTPFPNAEEPGLIPQTLAPLLEKRVRLKQRMKAVSRWDSRLKNDRARASAHKWLLVTCFGYLGYKNARFGRIEAHEAVTAYGREALLRAKEAAEEAACTVLQLYVDGLWIRHPEWKDPADFHEVVEAIRRRTGLPITLEGIYRWIAFLPSRQNPRVPVPNRYFGVFQDGTIKVRGIEARRRDTPAWVANVQMRVLEELAKAPEAAEVHAHLPAAFTLLHAAWKDLRGGRVPLEDLTISHRLSREIGEYRARSPAARATLQLIRAGKVVKPGQRVRFLFTRGEPGVHAWDLEQEVEEATIDHQQYLVLLQRAASTVLDPFGMEESDLRAWIVRGKEPVRQLPLPAPTRRARTHLPPTRLKTEKPAISPYRSPKIPQEVPRQ
jgi:DNA polymerase-2